MSTGLFWTPDVPNLNGWKDRHIQAMRTPVGNERPIVRMLEGFMSYADVYQARYEQTLSEDGVLGEAWRQTGKALIDLLNGECGRLDCGTVDALIRNTFTAQGFNTEGEFPS